MLKMAQGASVSVIASLAVLGLLVFTGWLEAQEGFSAESRRLELIDDALPQNGLANNDPLPASVLTGPTDAIPPFLAHPRLEPVDGAFSAEPRPQSSQISKSELDTSGQSIDECCEELSGLIADNIDSAMSVEAKKKMIEMALKMVAHRAETKLTVMQARHALERSRYQAQIASLRATSHVPMQIQRVMAPVYQALERNYLQATNSNQAFLRVSEKLDTMQRSFASSVTRESRPTIRLTPQWQEPESLDSERRLSQRIAELERELVNTRTARQNQAHAGAANSVRQAAWVEPVPVLRPRTNRQQQQRLPNLQPSSANSYRSPAPYIR